MSTAGAKRPLASRSKAKVERTAASRKKLKPAAELKIIETRVYRGPNYWSYEPGHQAGGRPGRAGAVPVEHHPRLRRGAAGHAAGGRQPLLRHGPPRRLRRAPARGHLVGPCGRAHRAAAAARGGHRGRPRQDAQHRRAWAVPRRLLVRRGERGPGGRAPGGSAGQPPGRRRGRTSTSGSSSRSWSCWPSARPSARRPRRILDEAALRDIPSIRLNEQSLVQLGHGVHQQRIRATMTSQTSSLGRRHRVRQEADQQAAGGDRRAGARAPRWSATSRRRPPRPRTHRLPGGGQAAGRQPWPGRRSSTWPMTAAVRAGYAAARAESRHGGVVVESYLTGNDYRCLVIGGVLRAVAQRVPAHVVGDGEHGLAELVEITNADPRRGIGHEKVLTRIKVDDESTTYAREQGFEMSDVPPRGVAGLPQAHRQHEHRRHQHRPHRGERTPTTSRSQSWRRGSWASTSPASTSSAPTSACRCARPAAASWRSTPRRASGCTRIRPRASRSTSPSR